MFKTRRQRQLDFTNPQNPQMKEFFHFFLFFLLLCRAQFEQFPHSPTSFLHSPILYILPPDSGVKPRRKKNVSKPLRPYGFERIEDWGFLNVNPQIQA